MSRRDSAHVGNLLNNGEIQEDALLAYLIWTIGSHSLDLTRSIEVARGTDSPREPPGTLLERNAETPDLQQLVFLHFSCRLPVPRHLHSRSET
jgi:hypothetical protein